MEAGFRYAVDMAMASFFSDLIKLARRRKLRKNPTAWMGSAFHHRRQPATLSSLGMQPSIDLGPTRDRFVLLLMYDNLSANASDDIAVLVSTDLEEGIGINRL